MYGCLAGRVYEKRVQGKLVFYKLKADGGEVQVMADVATSDEGLHGFFALHNSVKIGDIVGVTGFPGACCCTSPTDFCMSYNNVAARF